MCRGSVGDERLAPVGLHYCNLRKASLLVFQQAIACLAQHLTHFKQHTPAPQALPTPSYATPYDLIRFFSSSCSDLNGCCSFHREREHACGAAGAHGGGIGGGLVRERRPAAAADAVRDARRAAGDGAEGADAGRAVPGVRGVRGEQGQGAVQGRLLARLLRQPHGLATRLPGVVGGAGSVHGGVRPRRVRRERPGPGAVAAERGAGHPGPRRRAGPGPQVPPHLLLPWLPRRLGLRQVHPAPAARGGHDGAGDQLPVVGAATGPGPAALPDAAGRRPVVAQGRLLRAVAAALVDGPGVAAHLHCHRRLRALPQRARREEPRHRALHRNVPQEGEAGYAAGGAGVVLPRHGRHVREVAGVRADRPRGAAVPGAPVPGR